ncbi:C-terminal processing peptidase [Desulfosporosinus acidiphilus SJ4]|uniref:C-terminal processing peptidase n=1 Tax=Desulfosporosinus acidiphilus (strain DSM 22704 / JCM 16185 / SJ4) TaxID=646529 RepID=I4DBS0_DESAJ|nr:S41 family peptidase [Desulfosporosinus acidiphilus]AFM43244.1 C-terminal processing peptidase [Desulfosporosinus acidiphilus SJ4]
MLKSVFQRRVFGKIFANVMLSLILILSTSTSVWASSNDPVSEVRSLLQNKYVDPVSPDVLNAPTIDEMLKRLGDPHTVYFTPQQYKDFEGSVNNSFTGIGIHIQVLPEGIKVVSVVSGSPADEVGLKAGDMLLSADGQSLAGLSTDQAVNILRGPEGSTVKINVQRGSESKDFTVTRRAITEPTVTGSVLDGHIGYVDISTFGEETPLEFASTVIKLNSQHVNAWIVDLRDNGGGYLTSALSLAGFFIGPDVTIQVKDRSGILHLYQAPPQPFTLNKPIVFLTNGNSASASEVLTSAVKDYRKATIVGTTTYGKGTAQDIFPLSNGGVLKMTVDHFYSAFGHEINKVGITPDVEIEKADSLKAAELMLSDKTDELIKARTTDYWQAWSELSNSSTSETNQEPYSLFYPDYQKVNELSGVSLDRKFEIHFDGVINQQTVNDLNIELINSLNGERVPTKFNMLGSSDVQVIPEKALSPGTTYWLVVHPSILDASGKTLNKGTITIINTINASETEGKVKIQSLITPKVVGERMFNDPSATDYGLAIWGSDRK